MGAFRLLIAAAAAGLILAAFRDFENGGWLTPGQSPMLQDETEPVLGYDGMDQETIIEWLAEADLDVATLERMQRYESSHRERGPVLSAIDDLLE